VAKNPISGFLASLHDVSHTDSIFVDRKTGAILPGVLAGMTAWGK